MFFSYRHFSARRSGSEIINGRPFSNLDVLHKPSPRLIYSIPIGDVKTLRFSFFLHDIDKMDHVLNQPRAIFSIHPLN